MTQATQSILAILDSRSFASAWFWLLLLLAWTLAGRRVLGVPGDVIHAARRPEDAEGAVPATADDPAALRLLDWLSLSLPRWRPNPRRDALVLGGAAFLLSALAVLGFGYGLEMAQALVLLILPFALLAALELRLARRVAALVEAAETGALSANHAGAEAARLMARHRGLVGLVSVVALAVIAWHAAVWMLTHPFGY